MSVDPVAAAGFGSAADVYERARPSYPEDAIRWIAACTGLDYGRVVADVGAGTGKLTRLLVSTHARVIPRRGRERHRGGAAARRRLGRRRHRRAGVRDMDDPLQRTLEELLAPLGESKLFGAPQEKQFRIEQQLTTAGVCERVASTSFVAAMPAEDREALLEQVRAPAAGREEPFAFPYVTEVYVAARGV